MLGASVVFWQYGNACWPTRVGRCEVVGPMSSPQGAPRIVGRYAVFDAIASGGMASIHLGRLMGPAGFSRTVAVKRLHENYARDPEFVAMFLDEARIVARVQHPNVVPTVDVVAIEQELLLVMEYVPGETLGFLLERARLEGKTAPLGVIVDIMIGVLHGLHAAHEATNEKGEPLCIVHRDVSPQNILVGTDGAARVLDFGIAKAEGRMQHTRTGQLKGKLRYMAPEQLCCEHLERTADIYAASIVLWEGLTGERFISGDSDAVVMRRALEARSQAPSSLRPEVPQTLDEIVLRGLRRDPAERYPTAKEMANALEAAVESVPRSAVAAWVSESAHYELERRRERVAEVESDERSSSKVPRTRGGTQSGGSSSFHDQLFAGAAQGSKPGSSSQPVPAAGHPGHWLVAAGGAGLLLLAALTSPLPSRSSSQLRALAPRAPHAAAQPVRVQPVAAQTLTPEPIQLAPAAISAPTLALPQAPPEQRASASKNSALKVRRRRRAPAEAKSIPDRLYRRD